MKQNISNLIYTRHRDILMQVHEIKALKGGSIMISAWVVISSDCQLMFCSLHLRDYRIESQRGKDIIRWFPAGLSMQCLRWSCVNIKGNHFESHCMSCFINTTCTWLLLSFLLRWNCFRIQRWELVSDGGGRTEKGGSVGVPQATGGQMWHVWKRDYQYRIRHSGRQQLPAG